MIFLKADAQYRRRDHSEVNIGKGLVLVLLVPLALLEAVRLQVIQQGDEIQILFESSEDQRTVQIGGRDAIRRYDCPCHQR